MQYNDINLRGTVNKYLCHLLANLSYGGLKSLQVKNMLEIILVDLLFLSIGSATLYGGAWAPLDQNLKRFQTSHIAHVHQTVVHVKIGTNYH